MTAPHSSLALRLPLVIATTIALVGALLIGVTIGQGEFRQIYLLFFAIAAVTTVILMGSKYWLLIPIAFSCGLPAIPFRGRAFELAEVTTLLCAVVFICRYAIIGRGLSIFRWSHSSVLLYTAWAAVVFMLHPVGLFAMGSSTGGARFYLKIALA